MNNCGSCVWKNLKGWKFVLKPQNLKCACAAAGRNTQFITNSNSTHCQYGNIPLSFYIMEVVSNFTVCFALIISKLEQQTMWKLLGMDTLNNKHLRLTRDGKNKSCNSSKLYTHTVTTCKWKLTIKTLVVEFLETVVDLDFNCEFYARIQMHFTVQLSGQQKWKNAQLALSLTVGMTYRHVSQWKWSRNSIL